MITLIRDVDMLEVTFLRWEAYQVFAKQAGWRPCCIGRRHPGFPRLVSKRDAGGMAAALKRFVNGEQADCGELDLVSIVAMVNFLQGGRFLITERLA